jgi:hypothetical protein
MKSNALGLFTIVALALCWAAEGPIDGTDGGFVEIFAGLWHRPVFGRLVPERGPSI